MEKKILIKNFWKVGNNGDRNLYADDLGWGDSLKRAAKSDYPEYIFRYCVEDVGYNILFYWLQDRNFYTIETELTPIEARRIYPNPNWDGKCEWQKADSDVGPSTASAGEVIATFDNPTQIWNGLKINGVPIGDVLDNSVIIDLD